MDACDFLCFCLFITTWLPLDSDISSFYTTPLLRLPFVIDFCCCILELICLTIWIPATMVYRKCCVPNCGKTQSDNKILHLFPNPRIDSERLRTWIYAIGGDILAMENKDIFKKCRVCHDHFETKYHTSSKRLSANAVPTLHLTGTALHVFPNPEKYPERFKEWTSIVGAKLEKLTENEVYKKKRICDIHFLPEHKNRNNRLSTLAVPSLNLPDASRSITVTATPANVSDNKPAETPTLHFDNNIHLSAEIIGFEQPSTSTSAVPVDAFDNNIHLSGEIQITQSVTRNVMEAIDDKMNTIIEENIYLKNKVTELELKIKSLESEKRN